MPANQETPPWMGQQPPPPPGTPPGVPPPPPPGYAWQGSPGPPPPPHGSTGLLTFVGVMNLIFSVLCGCPTGGWAQFWGQVQDDPAGIVADIETHRADIKEFSDQNRRSRARGNPDIKVTADRDVEVVEALKEGVMAASTSPATPLLRKATMVAGIAQAVLLIGSILLLMHKNAGRVLSMLALLAFIAATAVAAVKFPALASWIADGIRTDVPDKGEIKDGLTVGIWSFSVVAVVWPAVSLLILLASRSIKEACQRTYPAA